MKNLAKWMLGAAVLAGGLGLGATSAQAAPVRVILGGGPMAYVPPCPGPGYVWVAGYYNDGYWVPGYCNYEGVGSRVVVGGSFGYVDRDRAYYRDRDDRRGYDSDNHRGGDRDHDHDRSRR